MSNGRFVLHRASGDEEFALESATILVKLDDGALRLRFEAKTGERVTAQPDTADLPAQPSAECKVSLKREEVNGLVGRQLSVPSGYDETTERWLATIYYLDHQELNNNKIEIRARRGERFHICWTATTPDVNAYDGSQPPTSVEIEGWFEFPDVDEWMANAIVSAKSPSVLPADSYFVFTAIEGDHRHDLDEWLSIFGYQEIGSRICTDSWDEVVSAVESTAGPDRHCTLLVRFYQGWTILRDRGFFSSAIVEEGDEDKSMAAARLLDSRIVGVEFEISTGITCKVFDKRRYRFLSTEDDGLTRRGPSIAEEEDLDDDIRDEDYIEQLLKHLGIDCGEGLETCGDYLLLTLKCPPVRAPATEALKKLQQRPWWKFW